MLGPHQPTKSINETMLDVSMPVELFAQLTTLSIPWWQRNSASKTVLRRKPIDPLLPRNYFNTETVISTVLLRHVSHQ